MTSYRLFLTKDKRTNLNYNHLVGRAWRKKPYYIYRVKLGDLLTKQGNWETVLLVVVSKKDRIIGVEIANALL